MARPGGSSAKQQEGEEVVRDAWAPAHGGVMAGKAGKASAAAPLCAGDRGSREREEEDNRLDLFANLEKFRGPTVKQK